MNCLSIILLCLAVKQTYSFYIVSIFLLHHRLAGEEEEDDLEDDMEDLNMTGVTVIAKAHRLSSHEDHLMLERCISSGMPTTSSQQSNLAPGVQRLPPATLAPRVQASRVQALSTPGKRPPPPVAMVIATPPYNGALYADHNHHKGLL